MTHARSRHSARFAGAGGTPSAPHSRHGRIPRRQDGPSTERGTIVTKPLNLKPIPGRRHQPLQTHEDVQATVVRWGIDRMTQANTDLLLAEESAIPGIEAIARGATLGEIRAPTTSSRAPAFIQRALRSLDITDTALADDMTRIFQAFLTGFARDEANLLVEVTERQLCPTFHTDNLNVRMIKTYFGPTTEYSRRDRPQEIQTVPFGSVIFLKGRRHPTHSETVHHRSPEVPAGKFRVCLIADF